MLSKSSVLVTACALALSLFIQDVTAAPFAFEDADLEIRSADISPASGLWASSSIILERDVEPDSPSSSLSLRPRQVQSDPSRVTGTGVQAGCLWRWLDRDTLDNAHCTVQDKGCDGHEVYATLQIVGAKGYKEIGKVKNASGCKAGAIRDPKANSYTDPWGVIYRARVRACVDDNGIKDTCFNGNFNSNPLQ
jgi:hypothetical protein